MDLVEESKTNQSRKMIKCFCNDEIQCGDDLSVELEDSAADQAYLNKFLSEHSDLKMRVCETETVCMTRKIKLGDKFFLKYSCDYSSKNSIRHEVVAFRDCKLNTEIQQDRENVLRDKFEHCCDDRFYCNIGLDPVKFSYEKLSPSGSSQPPPASSQQNVDPVLSLTNLILSCFSIAVFLICLFLFIFYLYKKFRIESAKNKFIKSQIYRGSVNTENTSSSATAVAVSVSPSNSAKTTTSKPLLSPYSSCQSTASTTNTSIHSKENSINFLKSNLYAVSDKNGEVYEPFLSSNAIKISSPISTPSSAMCHTISMETPSCDLEWSGSGSGAGFPQCVQRTIARQIRLVYPCIGKGRFGEVYKGEWRGELVAVKTFNSADEKSWENECSIYNTSGFRHENILGFIAADNIDRGLYTELWLITEYHENGSLFDYLSLNQLSPQQALKMALSIVNGLVHLHMPIESCNGKPALAHCDLKSKNILVKSDLSCCISDLGLALSGDRDGKLVQQGAVRTGTKRYMAPEILDKKIDARYLENFQKAEIYSLALVFWELLRSCKFQDDQTHIVYSFEYKLPYFEYIQGDPDEALMCTIVCEQKLRPGVCSQWRQNKLMASLLRLAEELWVENPNERLNALRLKKSLTKIRTNLVERNTLPTILGQ